MPKNELPKIDIAGILGISNLNDKGEFESKLDEVKKLPLSDTTIYGAAAETIFEKVVATLGVCKLIKKEDCGFYEGNADDLVIPDYRIVLGNGDNVLIEVKNCNSKNHTIAFSKEYICKLENYANLCKTKLMIAVYWNVFNAWTLNRIEDFTDNGDEINIPLTEAFKNTKMRMLGDLVIGLAPSLRFRIKADKISNKIININSSVIEARISGIEVIYDGKTIDDPDVKTTLIFFMFYGCWNSVENKVLDDGELYIDFLFKPENEYPNFGIIGSLSSITTRYYKYKLFGENKDKINLSIEGIKLHFDFVRKYREEKKIRLWIFDIVQK